jgi:hypothetical protein
MAQKSGADRNLSITTAFVVMVICLGPIYTIPPYQDLLLVIKLEQGYFIHTLRT